MKNKIKARILESLMWSEDTLNSVIFARPETALHDPFLYTNMDELVTKLHEFKLEQDKNPNKLLVADPDYDTDGIMSAAVDGIKCAEYVIGYYQMICKTKE